jgi:D-alanyl-D-alanine dipeptidase
MAKEIIDDSVKSNDELIDRYRLVLISPEIYPLVVELPYATKNNFMKQIIYQHPVLLLHVDASNKLKIAAKIASQIGLTLKVFDFFRPLEAQKKMFQIVSDDRYVSDPDHGVASHTRGIAVDLTLIDSQTGKELEMGTIFDDFTERAHPGNLSMSQTVLKNRALLAGIMHIAGFEKIDTEWWHYQLPNHDKYPKISQQDLGLLITLP